MIDKVNLAGKLASFEEHWVPKIVGALNDQYVKVVKFKGEYLWHRHDHEDELFMVLRGRIRVHLRDGIVELDEGEFCIVPRGVEHKPEAGETAEVLLFEPATTRNTGNVQHRYTIEAEDLRRI